MNQSFSGVSDNRDVSDASGSKPRMLSAPTSTLLALRAALLTRPDLETVFTLRDAGYAGASELYEAFETYVREKDLIDPQQLALDHFFQRAGEFWTAAGWGDTTFSADDDGFCVVEIDGCWEADPRDQPDPRGCHLTVGILGAFLGKFADYPLSVLEIEGPETDSVRCRFIAGSADSVSAYYAEHS